MFLVYYYPEEEAFKGTCVDGPQGKHSDDLSEVDLG